MGRYLDIAKRAIEQIGQEHPPVAPGPISMELPVSGAYDEQMQTSTTPAIPAGAVLRHGGSFAPSQCPALPLGIRMVRYEPKSPPVAIDVCSVVVDVEKFIQAELRELDARLHGSVQIRGGWGVFTILDRLRQVGLELEIDTTSEKVQIEPTAAPKTSKRDFRTPTDDGATK